MESLIVEEDSPNRYNNRRRNCRILFGIVSCSLFIQFLMIILLGCVLYQLKPLVNKAYGIVDDIKPILSKLKSLDLKNFNFNDVNMTSIHNALNLIPEIESRVEDFARCLKKSHLCNPTTLTFHETFMK